jgi:PhnB protein
MKLNTYVNFAGKCAEAFHFYEKHLGGKISMMMTHGQAPDQSRVNPEWKEAVLHARISIGDTYLMGADIPDAQPMRSAYLSLAVLSDGEAERIFSALSDGGEVFMPIQETFFATRSPSYGIDSVSTG